MAVLHAWVHHNLVTRCVIFWKDQKSLHAKQEGNLEEHVHIAQLLYKMPDNLSDGQITPSAG